MIRSRSSVPAWAKYIARNPDGSLYAFETKPEIVEIPGVYAGSDGKYIIGPPCPVWEPIDDSWAKAIEMPRDKGWMWGQSRGLFPDEWPGWRESLEEI